VVLIAVGNLPPGYLAKKILLAAPFALFIGICNPLLDRAVLVHLGPIGISGGWVSFALNQTERDIVEELYQVAVIEVILASWSHPP
jgi:hypothetical protein